MKTSAIVVLFTLIVYYNNYLIVVAFADIFTAETIVVSKCVHSTRMRLINAEASEGGLRGRTCVMEMAFTSS